MDRKAVTKLLTDVLIDNKLSDRKYYAKEVTLDYGTDHSKRIDVMEFSPKGVACQSDIEKGMFICYEIKSCREDVYSGNGLNFFGERNYVVTTMGTYKKLQDDVRSGEFTRFLKEHYPESSHHYGFLVAVPGSVDLRDTNAIYAEFEKPTPFEGVFSDWKLWTAVTCMDGPRKRSMTELLFCMLRSKHSYTNC